MSTPTSMVSPLSALTFVRLGVLLLGVFNLALTLGGAGPLTASITEPRRLRIKDRPELSLLHLDVPNMGLRTLITEETVHYPINGTLAELEWASLVPGGNHGVVVMGADARPYAVSMFHILHCLDRIRMAIVDPLQTSQARYHVHHCFNYVRQMVLCAADTRLNPINHVLPSGQLATDGIGLTYECRDWDKVYEAFEANYALNQPISFP